VPALGVVVPAGGRAHRLGGGKLTADVTGRNLLDRTLDGLPREAAVVCVGAELPTSHLVVWVQESPPFGGPLAAVAAGVAALPAEVVTVLVVGGDMPHAALAVPALLDALAPDDGAPGQGRTPPDCAVVVDGGGRRQPLLSAWTRTALVARLAALAPTDGRALAALLDDVLVDEVADAWGAAADVDTPTDLTAARGRFGQPLP
jgi:molybdopterin-guanine dinucleotide biosynthesis protein A